MPCLRALRREWRFPLAVLGPVDFLELLRFAAIFRGDEDVTCGFWCSRRELVAPPPLAASRNEPFCVSVLSRVLTIDRAALACTACCTLVPLALCSITKEGLIILGLATSFDTGALALA